MIQSKEYIIHQIANDIKTHIGQKYKDKSNIDWGLYTGLLGLIVFLFHCCPEKLLHNVSCLTASASMDLGITLMPDL